MTQTQAYELINAMVSSLHKAGYHPRDLTINATPDFFAILFPPGQPTTRYPGMAGEPDEYMIQTDYGHMRVEVGIERNRQGMPFVIEQLKIFTVLNTPVDLTSKGDSNHANTTSQPNASN